MLKVKAISLKEREELEPILIKNLDFIEDGLTVLSPQHSTDSGPPEPPAPPKSTTVVWEGELKREQWNLFSLKVLTRLAQAENVETKVKVQVTLEEGQTTEPLNTALKELGIQERSRKT